jgi:hypothetical protein
MRSILLNHFGLARPYQFARTLPAVAAAVLLLLVALTALYLSYRGHLTAWSPRAWYIAYLSALAMLVLVLAPWPRVAAALLMILTLEAGIGLGSLACYKFGLIPSETLAPNDKWGQPFKWHPLLQAKPVPSNAGAVTAISSEGWRGPERSADELGSRIVVALFGGSTTFDGMLRDGQAWSYRLQEILGPRYAVLNRGMGGYTTAEHLLQTAFYERTKGVTPACSVYYVGWNDLRNAHIAALDPAYADFHLPNQIDGFRARRTDIENSISPLATIMGRLLGYAFDTLRPATAIGVIKSDPDTVLEEIFARNVTAISAINRQRGIRTIWVGQLMNAAALTADTPSRWIPFVRERDTYGLIQRLNGILKREGAALGDVYVGLPAEKFGQDAFRDHGHCMPAGALRFATMLAPVIEDSCRRPAAR